MDSTRISNIQENLNKYGVSFELNTTSKKKTKRILPQPSDLALRKLRKLPNTPIKKRRSLPSTPLNNSISMCWGCLNDLENQIAHYGGCIPVYDYNFDHSNSDFITTDQTSDVDSENEVIDSNKSSSSDELCNTSIVLYTNDGRTGVSYETDFHITEVVVSNSDDEDTESDIDYDSDSQSDEYGDDEGESDYGDNNSHYGDNNSHYGDNESDYGDNESDGDDSDYWVTTCESNCESENGSESEGELTSRHAMVCCATEYCRTLVSNRTEPDEYGNIYCNNCWNEYNRFLESIENSRTNDYTISTSGRNEFITRSLESIIQDALGAERPIVNDQFIIVPVIINVAESELDTDSEYEQEDPPPRYSANDPLPASN